MKRFFALALTLVSVLSLFAACSKQNETTGSHVTTAPSSNATTSSVPTTTPATPIIPTVAVVIGGHEVSAVELNYFYIDAISTFCNQYGSYISYLIDISAPLNAASNTDASGQSWADKFLDMAFTNMKSIYQLYDAATAAGYELSESERANIDSVMSYLNLYATYYGHADADAYLVSMYGSGCNTANYRKYYELCTIAESYYQQYYDSQVYTDADLRAYEADKFWKYSSYTYAYYYLDYNQFLIGSSEGAKETARQIAKQLADQITAGEYEDVDAFNEGIHAVLTGYFGGNEAGQTYTATCDENVLYSKLDSLFADWLSGTEGGAFQTARQECDMVVIPNETSTGVLGYYVLRFGGVNDNNFNLKNVRHLLVMFEGGIYNSVTGETVYTDKEKAAAKAKAEELLAQFEATGKTSAEFAFMADRYSDDNGGNVTNGGLYENIYPGQMVASFNDWCFEEGRQHGDYGLIESPYGWHIMFFESDSETTYRDYMLENDLRQSDVTAWLEALVESTELVKKDLSHVNMELVLSSS